MTINLDTWGEFKEFVNDNLNNGYDNVVDTIGYLSVGKDIQLSKLPHLETNGDRFIKGVEEEWDVIKNKASSVKTTIVDDINTGIKYTEYGLELAGILGLIVIGSYVYSNIKK
jgi:hypothetical protein